MYNIAIRADGGPTVGMGHIMRCLAVAETLNDLGFRVYFISRYKQGIDKVASMGFEVFEIRKSTRANDELLKCGDKACEARKVKLSNCDEGSISTGFNYGSNEELVEDIRETRSIIEKQSCELLLVDKYNLTAEYFNKLKEFVSRAAFIDDINMYNCSADIIINGNINALLLGYQKNFSGQKLLLGTSFTPLRKEFNSIPKRELRRFIRGENTTVCSAIKSIDGSEQLPEIMITTGGADPYNCTGKMLEILVGDERTVSIRYNVIVSSSFVHKNQIQRMADENANIVLYIDHNCLSEVMCQSDLAISSGGSTLYELCCCGTTTLAFIMADNQKGIVETLANGGYIYSLGWYNEVENANLSQVVAQLIRDIKKRKNYSEKMQSLIDGRGALRIAKEIVDVVSRKDYIRDK